MEVHKENQQRKNLIEGKSAMKWCLLWTKWVWKFFSLSHKNVLIVADSKSGQILPIFLIDIFRYFSRLKDLYSRLMIDYYLVLNRKTLLEKSKFFLKDFVRLPNFLISFNFSLKYFFRSFFLCSISKKNIKKKIWKNLLKSFYA